MIAFQKAQNIHPAWMGMASTLLLLLAALWLLPGHSPAPGHIPAGPAATPPDLSGTAASQWGSTALARPLFIPGRQPAGQPGTSTDSSLPRLSAIILVGGHGMAVFSASGKKPQLVNQGGRIGGYELARVTPGYIELSGPDGLHRLRPQFTPVSGQPPPPPNPSGTPTIMSDQITDAQRQ